MYWMYWVGLLFAAAALLTAFGIIAGNRGKRVPTVTAGDIGKSPYGFPKATDLVGGSRGFELQQLRLFPYSVIPGGVESAQELRDALARDPVVARHYADFDLSRARIIRLDRDREVYVSYRMGDRIYWTKKKLKLLKGESVITDGKHEARTRCGNQLSETSADPVSPNEPPAKAMAAVPPPALLAVAEPPSTGVPLVLPSPPGSTPTNPPGWVIVPPVFPIVGGSPPLNPPMPPPVPTPEPNTLSLLATGLSIVVAAGLLARYQKRRNARGSA